MKEITRLEQMQRDKRTLYKRNYLIKKYGGISRQRKFLELSPYQYELDKQGGVCAICKNVCSSGRSLAIDHCHKKNTFRGLLCTKCNRGLGFFNDDILIIQNAINYLKKQ